MWLVIFLCIVVIVIALKLYFVLTTGLAKTSKHLVGKVVIVTGGNAGIGYETAKDLADRGAKVIIGCRNEDRGTTARDQIIAATGNSDVHYRNIDFALLASVRKFADEFVKTEKRLDILINNAGVFEDKFKKTEDGLLLGMQINHFGPFLLTNLLLPLLKSSAPSRIITVSSMAYSSGKIDFDNLNMEMETGDLYRTAQLYANTKLANILMTVELNRVLKGTGVSANALHPGAVYTTIVKNVQRSWVKLLYYYLPFRFIIKTPWEGAQTSIYLAVSPEVENISGCYFSDCKEKKLKEHARDPVVAKKLWEVSERFVKLRENSS